MAGRSKIFSKGPEIGEIVVFFPPHKPTVPFVKRVIAKGGDTISYVNKRLYINGEEYEQKLVQTDAFGVEITKKVPPVAVTITLFFIANGLAVV